MITPLEIRDALELLEKALPADYGYSIVLKNMNASLGEPEIVVASNVVEPLDLQLLVEGIQRKMYQAPDEADCTRGRMHRDS